MRFIGPLKLVFYKCRACIQGQTAPLLHPFEEKPLKSVKMYSKTNTQKINKKGGKAIFYLLFRPLFFHYKKGREALFYQYFKKIL